MIEVHRVFGLGACPRIERGRVPGLEGADARRRDAGDVSAHRRGAPTKQMPLPSRNPKGAWGLHDDRCVARRRRCTWTSPPPRALRSPCKPHARDPFQFSDRLLGLPESIYEEALCIENESLLILYTLWQWRKGPLARRNFYSNYRPARHFKNEVGMGVVFFVS